MDENNNGDDFLAKVLETITAKNSKKKPKQTLTEATVAKVQEIISTKRRLTYTALVAIHQGTSPGEGQGLFGSTLAKQLPQQLQAFVCRNNGTYHKSIRPGGDANLDWDNAFLAVFSEEGLDRVKEAGFTSYDVIRQLPIHGN